MWPYYILFGHFFAKMWPYLWYCNSKYLTTQMSFQTAMLYHLFKVHERERSRKNKNIAVLFAYAVITRSILPEYMAVGGPFREAMLKVTNLPFIIHFDLRNIKNIV